MPTPTKAAYLRPALAPGLLAAVALVAGVVVLDSTIFVGFRYVVSILALIVLVFAWRGRAYVYLPFLAAIAVLWNPVYVIPLTGQLWQSFQFAAGLVFVVAGIRIRVPAPEAPAATRGGSVSRRR
ncbi:hypothetical protein AS850_08690 [Frondihabitans sp. 762G35]|uniref:DUF6804 family protein n=1 Tax=Frondihabitans sp. 762G35 TaxID=1446794 RepID=UPI000D226661|nr:DUF6804 family protein [Frondihabitans sp. 762G35]ARC57150.1 hypothetical protein AS850_08690 [Frondihabitans sp. 762G35]